MRVIEMVESDDDEIETKVNEINCARLFKE